MSANKPGSSCSSQYSVRFSKREMFTRSKTTNAMHKLVLAQGHGNRSSLAQAPQPDRKIAHQEALEYRQWGCSTRLQSESLCQTKTSRKLTAYQPRTPAEETQHPQMPQQYSLPYTQLQATAEHSQRTASIDCCEGRLSRWACC